MNVGVYGLGRFGAFWAEQLSRHIEVKGFNRTVRTSAPEGVALVSEDEVLSCDTVVLCVAISSFKDVVSRIAPRLRPKTVVMDTCSVKVYPTQVMKELLPPGIGIIATHPMFGPDSGKFGVSGLPLVFSPVRSEQQVVSSWRAIFESMRLQVLEMDCERHDREAAYSQGVTHFVGRVLDELHLAPTQLATVGYRNLMSIVEQTCNDPLQLFYDLQRYNPYAHDMHVRLKEALEAVLGVLDAQDISSMESE